MNVENRRTLLTRNLQKISEVWILFYTLKKILTGIKKNIVIDLFNISNFIKLQQGKNTNIWKGCNTEPLIEPSPKQTHRWKLKKNLHRSKSFLVRPCIKPLVIWDYVKIIEKHNFCNCLSKRWTLNDFNIF